MFLVVAVSILIYTVAGIIIGDGRFSRTSFRVPVHIAAACCAALSMAMSPILGWPRELCSTLATLSAGVVCWLVLMRTCLPLNLTRKILLAVVIGAFAGAFFLLRRIFFLEWLSGTAWLVLAGLAVLGGGIILLCDWLIARHEAAKKAKAAAA